jgi:YidC/Oxa1 family membrane protein insertase
MAEFRNPNQGNSDGVRSIVIMTILMVGIFFGLRQFSASTGSHTALPHAQQTSVEAAKPASPTSSGSMNFIERELFVVLALIQSHVAANWTGSWGWAIVLLTIGINLLMLPLRIASMRSGLKMQRIQPEIKAIRARYKNIKLTDPRHNDMNAEIAKLQKDNGVNVLGGCVPLLIQAPLLFAFFGMLRKATALHGAQWFWLHDLSSADPLHILPVLMCVFQLLVQVYTPSPGSDAKQQKIMACLMTVGFGYVSWHYASGLALYALTGSLLSLATQAAMNRSTLGREMKALRTTAG